MAAKIFQTGRELLGSGEVAPQSTDQTCGKRQTIWRCGECDQAGDIFSIKQILPAGISSASEPSGGTYDLTEPVFQIRAGSVELPLKEVAEEGVTESAQRDRSCRFLDRSRKRVEAKLYESVGFPGAEIGFRPPHVLAIEVIGKLP